MRRCRAITAVGFAVLLIVAPVAQADFGLIRRTVASPGFVNTGAVAAGVDGSVYVLDGAGNQPQRIRRFDAELHELGPWPAGGVTFSGVSDLAVDLAGDVYVAGRQGVQKFAADGTLLDPAWSVQPTSSLSTAPAADIFANDAGPITVRDAGGQTLRTLPGSAVGLLAASAAGDVYQDAGNSVSHLSPTGQPLAPIGSTPDRGPAPDGAFAAGPGPLAVDAAGQLWVVDRLGQRLDRFSRNGSFLAACGARSLGRAFTPGDVATGPGGRLYVVQPRELDLLGPGAARPCDDVAPELGPPTLARRSTDRHPPGVRRWRLTVALTETTTLRLTPWRRRHDPRCARLTLTPSHRTLARGTHTIAITARSDRRCRLRGVTVRGTDRAGNAARDAFDARVSVQRRIASNRPRRWERPGAPRRTGSPTRACRAWSWRWPSTA